MNPSAPQNTQNTQGGHLPAMVLGYNDEVSESTRNNYPEALAVSPHNAAPAKTIDDDGKKKTVDEESVRRPEALRPAGPHDFSSGICDLQQSWMIFCDAYCCMYCVGSAQHNFFMNEQEGVFVPLCCGMLCVDVGLAAISPYLPSSIFFHTLFMRHVIRQRYHLHSNTTPSATGESIGDEGVKCNGEFLLDCLTAYFCTACAIAQHQREIIVHGDWCGGVLSDRHSMDTPEEVHTV